MVVIVAAEPSTGALDIETLTPGGVWMIGSVPADENVGVGCDEFQRIAQPSADCNIHNRHGGARSAGRLVDKLSPGGDHAVQERDTRIVEVEIAHRRHVVFNAKVLLKHLEQERGAQIGLAIAIVLRPSWAAGSIKMTLGFQLHLRGPFIERGQAVIDIEIFSTRQAGRPAAQSRFISAMSTLASCSGVIASSLGSDLAFRTDALRTCV
jgi:hypothetical protein